MSLNYDEFYILQTTPFLVVWSQFIFEATFTQQSPGFATKNVDEELASVCLKAAACYNTLTWSGRLMAGNMMLSKCCIFRHEWTSPICGGGLRWWPQDQVSADHVVLSAPSGCDGKLSPELFSCEAARVKISNSKSETVIHSQKRGPNPQASTWDENLPQVKSSRTTLVTEHRHSCQILVQRKTWKKREFRAPFSLLCSPPDSGSGTEDGWNTSPSHMWAEAV